MTSDSTQLRVELASLDQSMVGSQSAMFGRDFNLFTVLTMLTRNVTTEFVVPQTGSSKTPSVVLTMEVNFLKDNDMESLTVTQKMRSQQKAQKVIMIH